MSGDYELAMAREATHPPVRAPFKLNTDAAVRGEECGIGMVVCDREGYFLMVAGECKKVCCLLGKRRLKLLDLVCTTHLMVDFAAFRRNLLDGD